MIDHHWSWSGGVCFYDWIAGVAAFELRVGSGELSSELDSAGGGGSFGVAEFDGRSGLVIFFVEGATGGRYDL